MLPHRSRFRFSPRKIKPLLESESILRFVRRDSVTCIEMNFIFNRDVQLSASNRNYRGLHRTHFNPFRFFLMCIYILISFLFLCTVPMFVEDNKNERMCSLFLIQVFKLQVKLPNTFVMNILVLGLSIYFYFEPGARLHIKVEDR